MKLTFAGTRGLIDRRTRRHRRHSSLLIEYRKRRVMIDCGEDWRGHIDELKPHAIVLTHAHPDHAFGLADGAPCPVYATTHTWEDIHDYPLPERHTVKPRQPFEVEQITFEAFTVEHSTRCPAVGYRIRAGRPNIFYCPDVVYIHQREDALHNARLYIGDGATLDTDMIRKRGDNLIGHTPVRTQLTWCAQHDVPEMIVTHCGKQIVGGDERSIRARLNQWAHERNLEATLAHDGMTRILR